MTLLEGWAQQALPGLTWADHTYVKCPANGQFFDCWADDHTGPDQRRIMGAQGRYAVANCYRGSIWPFRDTAFIGIYAVDGVCHQSANCFLYSTNSTLTYAVRGYWFSVFSYGVYGKAFWRWLGIYNACYWANAWKPERPELASMEEEAPEALPDRIRALHASVSGRRRPMHPHELIMAETDLATREKLPGFQHEKVKDVQAEYLEAKERLTRAERGKGLARKINDLAKKTQEQLAKRMDRDEYRALMGVDPGEALNLVEWEDLAGRPVPLPPPDTEPQPEPESEAQPK